MKIALAIDGGNSKTDVAARRRGRVAARRSLRGRGSSPHHLGGERSLDVIGALVERARAGPERPRLAVLTMAGVDFPRGGARSRRGSQGGAAGRSASTSRNDTFAVLRAGTDRGWGVAVVCGAGSTASASRPTAGTRASRRSARSRATGAAATTSGQDALFAAARSEDGRGPRTRARARSCRSTSGSARRARWQSRSIAGGSTAHRLRRARAGRVRLRQGTTRWRRRSSRDSRPRWSRSCASPRRRLELEDAELEVVLGGGLLQDAAASLVAEIAARRARDGAAALSSARPPAPAILGSALLALDELGADDDGEGAPAQRARSPHVTRHDRRSSMAEVRFDRATRIYAGNDVPAVERARARDRRRRVRRARRPVGIRQDDRAANACRARGGRRRLDLHRRPRRDRR